MGRFYPLYPRRSDGKLELIAKGKRKEVNQPTEDQLDQKPDKNGVSDFYREVGLEEPKHMDWRRKLGGMLARELNAKQEPAGDNGYMLAYFPENYRLYEHIKKTEKDGKTEVKSKTHAAGANDRQDAYLYGHPDGRRKRFRSPNDFFPHLLWLCTDESGDPDNCSCKICSPEDLENLIPGAKPAARPIKQEPDTKPVVQPNVMARTPSAQGARPAPGPAQSFQQRPASVSARQPSPLPPPKDPDQRLDLQYRSFMYRPGELVWFKREQAWGLGCVLRRWVPHNGSHLTAHYYTVQPLSYPYEHPAPVTKTSDADLRPWLAWSVPKFTNDGLNQLPDPPRYETADWQGMMQRRYGHGDMEVDGSILAAKAVDSTYTLIRKSKTIQAETNVTETHYDGVFLGAEKIWVGDSVRLAIGSSTDILVVHSVIEQRRPAPMPAHGMMITISFLGDVYTLSQVAHSNPQIPTPAAMSNNPQLPTRLTEDLNFRNARSIPNRRIASFWKFTSGQHRVNANEIKGRWYEASLIMPILHPQQFEEASRKGDIQESSLWMNARGDCLNSNRPPNLARVPRENIRKEIRREAFGRAMPSSVEIRDGVQPPLPENVDPSLEAAGSNSGNAIEIDPRFETADDAGTGGVQHNQGGALEEFMDLDGMTDNNGMQDFGGSTFF